jgi:hypothetical protein
MIVIAPPLVASGPPGTHVALVHGLRVNMPKLAVTGKGFEALSDQAKVGEEVRRPIAVLHGPSAERRIGRSRSRHDQVLGHHSL